MCDNDVNGDVDGDEDENDDGIADCPAVDEVF